MFEKPIFYIVLVAIVTIFLVRRIRIAQEGERFAVHVLGKFVCLKGSGYTLNSQVLSQFGPELKQMIEAKS